MKKSQKYGSQKASLSPRGVSMSTVASLEPEPSPSPAPDPCDECEILLDGKSITESNSKVLPGQAIKLSLKCEEGTPTEITWTIPAKTFTEYTTSTPANSIAYLEDSDLHATTVKTFYWTDSGKKSVSVAFKVKDKDDKDKECSKNADITVAKPKCEFSVDSVGSVKPNATGTLLQLLGDPTGEGIQFKGKVSYEAGDDFPAGLWGTLQTIKDDWAQHRVDAPQCVLAKYPGEVIADGATQPHLTFATGTGGGDSDSPGIATINASLEYSRSSRCFRTYIMFKPSSGKWVPLKVIRWQAWGCVAGATVSTNKGVTTGDPQETTEHPLWTHNSEAGMTPTKPGDCPANPGCTDWTKQSCD